MLERSTFKAFFPLAGTFFGLLVADMLVVFGLYISLPQTSHLRGDQEIHRQRFQGGPHEDKIHLGGENYVALTRVPKALVQAVLLQEDSRFYEHNGIDLREILTALSQWSSEQKLRGASTITQQLARNLFLSGERALRRKALEALISLKMEIDLPKWRILELYFNSIDWGENLIGLHKAADFYFGKTAEELSVFQCVYLASLIPNPALYSKDFQQLKFQSNMNVSFERLLKTGVISLEDYRRALNERLVWQKRMKQNASSL